MRSAAFILTLTVAAFWPFHHRQARDTIDPLVSPDEDTPCIVEYGMFAYEGSDGSTGFSKVSCRAAFEDWRNTPSPGREHARHRV